MSENSIHLKSIFGEVGPVFVPLVANIAARTNKHEYRFKTVYKEEFDRLEFGRLIVLEILYRAHMAALLNIIRTDRWIKAILSSYGAGNYLAFSASFRGLLESTGDAGYSLIIFPRFMAENAKEMVAVLNGNGLAYGPGITDMECRLINFLNGKDDPGKQRNKPTLEDNPLVARSTREYLKYTFEKEFDSIYEFYSELCEITHPAALSVQYLLESSATDKGTTYVLNNDTDVKFIRSLSHRCSDKGSLLFERGIVPSLMTLKLINLINEPGLVTAVVDSVNLDGFGRFEEFRETVAREVQNLTHRNQEREKCVLG